MHSLHPLEQCIDWLLEVETEMDRYGLDLNLHPERSQGGKRIEVTKHQDFDAVDFYVIVVTCTDGKGNVITNESVQANAECLSETVSRMVSEGREADNRMALLRRWRCKLGREKKLMDSMYLCL